VSRSFKDNSTTPEAELVAKESNELIERAISHLPPQQKLVYRLVRSQGMKLKEVSAEMGLSRNTVKNHLGRAVRFIQAFMQQGAHVLILAISAFTSL
jgi:RNA polymerase sigma-70 factor (ECF subfamily)